MEDADNPFSPFRSILTEIPCEQQATRSIVVVVGTTRFFAGVVSESGFFLTRFFTAWLRDLTWFRSKRFDHMESHNLSYLMRWKRLIQFLTLV